jgi:hypothetical protein
MTFPTGTVISTANLDSPDDDPSLARVDLYDLAVAVNNIIASANGSQGVLVLNSSGKINGSLLPATFSTASGSINIQPANGVVGLNRVLRLQQTFSADLGSANGTQSPSAGDVAYLVDGDAGQPCIGCYDGTKWRIVRLMSQVGDVGASITATATLVAEADA